MIVPEARDFSSQNMELAAHATGSIYCDTVCFFGSDTVNRVPISSRERTSK